MTRKVLIAALVYTILMKTKPFKSLKRNKLLKAF